MKALLYDPHAPQGLRLGQVADPVPRPTQALIGVQAVSLNFGELAYRASHAQPGEIHGWDASGVVI
jgi:NADPH:quinone reductase-like Zn-dependent oxidoreductase